MKRVIDPLRNGTVIDHITAGQGLKVLKMINLSLDKTIIALAINVPSKKLIRKDLIMLENTELNVETLNAIALISPKVTISIIRNEKVIKKFKIDPPKSVQKIIICPNPKCISNVENVKSNFYLATKGEKIIIRCHYCEKKYPINRVQIKI